MELPLGGPDLALGVLRGVAQVHGGAGGDAGLEVGLAEHVAEVVHDGGEVQDPADVAAGAGAVEGGGGGGLFEAVEQDGEVGEHKGQVADVTGSVHRVESGFEQLEGSARVTVAASSPATSRDKMASQNSWRCWPL